MLTRKNILMSRKTNKAFIYKYFYKIALLALLLFLTCGDMIERFDEGFFIVFLIPAIIVGIYLYKKHEQFTNDNFTK